MRLQREVIVVLARGTLGKPEEYGRQHERDILGDVGVAVVRELFRVPAEDVLQHQDRLYRAPVSE